MFESGDTKRALECYRAGIEVISGGCRQNKTLPHRSNDRRNETKEIEVHKSVKTIMIKSKICSTYSDGKNNQDALIQQPPFATHSYLFRTTNGDDAEEPSPVTVEDISLCSALMIYNCALAFHQRGNERALKKSLVLYQQCLELLETIVDHFDGSLSVVQSTLRNQADVFYKLQDFYSAEYTLSKLHKLLQEECILAATVQSESPQLSLNAAPEA